MYKLRNYFLFLFSIFFLANVAKSQEAASVTWSCMEPDSQNVSTVSGKIIGLKQIGSPGFEVRDYNNGPGPEQRWWPYQDGAAVPWGDETAQVDSRWIQFAVLPNTNFNFDAESFQLNLGAKGTNGIRANVYYSTDYSFSNATKLNDAELELVKDTDSLYNFNINAAVNSGDTLYVRIYPWYTGSSSTSKYVYVRNAVISGTTSTVTYPASALWELTDPDNGGTGLSVATSGQVKADDENLHKMEINHYSGPNNSQRIRIEGNEWPANQTEQIDSVYVEFAVGPKTGYNLNVTSVSFGIAGVSINTMKANIYYSTDPNFTSPVQVEYTTADSINNYLGRDELQPISFAPNTSVASGEKFYVRIYPWVDNDPSIRTGKYIALQDVMIAGDVEGNPMHSKVEWTFDSDDSPTTTGPIIAKNQEYSSTMKWYGTTTLPNDLGNDVTVGAIQTVSKTWFAEPNPTDTLYFQYEVAPKFGGTFFVDSVSMYLGGWFTKNLRAAIYYSKDPTFTEKTLLISDTSLVGNAVAPLSASLDVTINSGETFYLRVYPHNTEAEGWAKLVAVDNVIISGTTIGVTADPPTVTTDDITGISSTFATSGGNISTDGGSVVTARGVVWNTNGSPTINDSKTVDGEGSGSFVSVMKGLMPGKTYYVKAYATNDAGTSYGEEIAFTTLDSTEVPTVVTAAVENILVKSAEGGGTVTSWGGDTVLVKGVCWNTSGNPTIADGKTENGSGLGAFTSTLYPLEATTKYYVRAYATNGKGTGYGNEIEFTTQAPEPDVYKVVAKDGSGDYTTVQAAFNDVPDYYTGKYHIFVKNGEYYEKLFLDRKKVNVILEGESRDGTILTYDDYAGKAGGTSNSYSVAIDADDFVAVNITFQNTVKNDKSVSDQQAVALRVNGDRQAYYNCNLLGYQDTYYTWGGRATGRTYMKNCFIEGSVDFIFGRNVVLFDSCHININRDGGTLTAAATNADASFGYVFKDCKLTADSIGFDGNPIESFYLGRPWQDAPRTVFINCEEDKALDPEGWLKWNVTPALYAEYDCYGPGSNYSQRNSISRQLTSEEAAKYTIENIFAKTTFPTFGYDWIPSNPLVTDVKQDNSGDSIPKSYKLFQNYPNPFNPSTKISYQIPSTSRVEIRIYNLLGQLVKTLVNKEQAPGNYEVTFDASSLASGIYFLNLKAGQFIQTKKMMLLK